MVWFLYENGLRHERVNSINPQYNTVNIKRYIRCSHARFGNKAQPLKFLDIINCQDLAIQYIVKFQNVYKQ